MPIFTLLENDIRLRELASLELTHISQAARNYSETKSSIQSSRSLHNTHLGNAHKMEHREAPYRMPFPPSQRISSLYSADDTELTQQRQLQNYLLTKASAASNHMHDTSALIVRRANSQQYRDDDLRMPLPPSQQRVLAPLSSDLEDAELIRQRQLEHLILSQASASASNHAHDTNALLVRRATSQQYQDDGLRMPLPPSQQLILSPSNLEDAELIRQRQLEHIILLQASATDHVNDTSTLFLQASSKQHQDAQYNQLLQNELKRIIHSSSMIPKQQLQQHNYHVNTFASAASPSVASTNVQVRRDISASMKCPPAVHPWSVQTLPPAGLTFGDDSIAMSSRNLALLPTDHEAPRKSPPIRNDVAEAKAEPIDAFEQRTPPNSTATLIALGHRPRKTAEPYIDVSDMARDLGSRPPVRGGVINRFPEKLHQMLKSVEAQGESQMISFYPHGRAFGIHDGARFEAEILPKFLPEQGKLFSFVRQLNLYGFIRINSGPDSGGYYHELFLKGRPGLTHFMRRVGAPKTGPKTDVKKEKKSSPRTRRHQPNFYAMKRVLPAQHDE
jgi:hypothetical protein